MSVDTCVSYVDEQPSIELRQHTKQIIETNACNCTFYSCRDLRCLLDKCDMNYFFSANKPCHHI